MLALLVALRNLLSEIGFFLKKRSLDARFARILPYWVNVARPFGPRYLRSVYLKEKGPRMLALLASLLLDGEKICDIILGAKFHLYNLCS